VPGEFYDYYARVADRILPFLRGRQIAIEQRFPDTERIIYRRHAPGAGDDTWIRIADTNDLLQWARQYAVGFHGHIRSEDRGAWFVIDIDSRDLSTEMARIAAIHAADVLTEQGLEPLVKFSGSDGYHLMWDAPDLNAISDAELWELARAVVRAVACEVERRLAADPAANPIRAAVGAGKPAIATGNADRENADALLFDEFILKDNANFRLPYSVHPGTGLVAVPLTREQLATFHPKDANPDAVAAKWPALPLPVHAIADVRRALQAWHDEGC
jgi:DNA primase